MDNIADDYLTNLSWLKVPKSEELQSTAECSNNHIDDDLQCLCWIMKIRPNLYSNHLVKRLSSGTGLSGVTNTINHYHSYKRSLSSSYSLDSTQNRVLNAVVGAESIDNNPSSRQILMVRTFDNHSSPIKSSQYSFIFIRLSNGKISCLSVRPN